MRLCYTFLLAMLLSVTATAQTTILDFEGDAPIFEDFNGSVSTILANPDATAPNTSATVVENVLPIAQGFAGIKITQTIDLKDGKSFTMKVWSPIENAPVLLKFEGSSTSGDIERPATFTGAANSWQELTFDFATEGENVFEFVVVFMNFNINTNADPITFYWDELVQIDVPAPDGDQMDLPVTFDDEDVNYGIVAFEGADAAIVADPTDAANQVGQVTKGTESGTSAGATVTSLPGGPAGFASPIPFTASATTMSVRVWSPTAGIPVRLKVENADNPGVSVETEAMVTVAAAWDTLVFDFAQQATGTAAINLSSVYNVASIFFDFGSVPAATTDYYFDDMIFGGAGGGTGVLPVTLPVDFESTELTYDFGGFEGADSAIETNPDQTGENTSATVMRSTKTDGAQFFAGTFLSLGEPIDFSVNKGIAIQTWSPKADIPVRIRLENADNSVGIELDVNTTTANGWETLVADFSAQINPAVDYVKVVVFFEFVVDLAGDGSTYYFDNIEVVEAGDGTPGVALPVDFESTELTYDFGGFEGADSAIETNPDQTGENTSATVMRTTKTDGAQFFAGTFLSLNTPIDFSTNKGISIQSWSPKVGIPVKIRLEDAGNTEASIEVDVTTTVASSWETLTADFSSLINPAINYVKVVVFYEFVVDLPGDGTTYYYDNIEVVEAGDGGGATQMDLPVTFDEEGVDYGLAGFGNADGAVVVDPTDATNMVGQVIKNAGAEVWAGVTITSTSGGPDGFASSVPFAADATTITVRTWSPAAGVNVLLKAEQTDDATVSVETNAMTTVAGGWETLTFDFSNEADGTAALDLNAVYGKVSIFFDFGNQPAEAATYYFDDVIFDGDGGGGGDDAQMDLPVTFDEEGVDYGLAGFGNADGAVVVDPTDVTNMVGQVIKNAGAEVWAGVTITSTSGGPDGFASSVPFAADATIISVRTWSPAAGVNVLLKAEQTDDATVSVETNAMTTVAGGWETLTFDFSNEADGTAALDLNAVYGKVSIFFDFGNQPAEAATYYFDDVIFGDVVSTNEPLLGLLEAFPNPIGNEFSIVAPERMESLLLFSANGSKVGEWQPNTERFSLEASHLAPGMYVALVRTNRGLMTIKLVKE